MTSSNITVPVPWTWQPSNYFDGNDGSWNTFIVQVGTPPQRFRVLPSTAGQETWILDPQGCGANDPPDCAYSRGALNGSDGFRSNDSSTWKLQGLYELDKHEQDLGYYGNGKYGFDTVTLGTSESPLRLTQQIVASIADKSYLLGQFGLGPKPINFTNFADPIPNFVSNLAGNGSIPSTSFGYTAGAAYRNQTPASLTLGGYDASRFTPSDLTYAMNADNSRPLQVGITKIIATNTLSGTSNLLPSGTYHYIDSTVPHIWLPSDAAQAFAAAFGLTYDNRTDFYLINDTVRLRHLQSSPTITFFLSANPKEGVSNSQTIVLPYSAFDLKANHPFYDSPTYYFPLRIARNSSQYTLGRTFLQEAYLVADWERQNFTIGQTRFNDLDHPRVVPILSKANEAAINQTSQTNSAQRNALNAGPLAGIVVGSIAGIMLLVTLAFLLWRRTRARQNQPLTEYYNVDSKGSQPSSDVDNYAQTMLRPLRTPMELDGSTAKWGRAGVQEVASKPVGHELGHGDALPGVVAEVEAAQPRQHHELPGSDPADIKPA